MAHNVLIKAYIHRYNYVILGGYVNFSFNRFSLSIITITLLNAFTGCSVSPQPFKKETIVQSAQDDLYFLAQDQSEQKSFTLATAIKQGIDFNREKRVKLMEAAIAHQQIDLLKYDFLPQLTTSAGYSLRDNYAASASTAFEGGTPNGLESNPNYYVSQSKKQVNAGITFSWNILDFGLSYVRSEQQADKYLIEKERERKVNHNITQEIRKAYYQAVTSEELLKRINPLMREVRQALRDSEKVKRLRLKSPMEALTYERELLDILRDLNILQKTFISSRIELAELLGLKPNTKFELTEKVQDNYNILDIPFKLSTMEKIALENRPEILESRYKERISEKELSAVTLKMLPGLSFNTGHNYNDSSYLLNNGWNTVGVDVTWNLFNIFKHGPMSESANANIMLAREQKLALSLAVITQVHLSVLKYKQSINEYKLSKEYLDVSQEIYKQALNTNKLNMSSKLVIIKEKLSFLLATLRHSSAYANMQNSYGRIYASLGINKDSDVTYKTDYTPKVVLTPQEIQKNELLLQEERKKVLKQLKERLKRKEQEKIKEQKRLKLIQDAKLRKLKKLKQQKRDRDEKIASIEKRKNELLEKISQLEKSNALQKIAQEIKNVKEKINLLKNPKKVTPSVEASDVDFSIHRMNAPKEIIKVPQIPKITTVKKPIVTKKTVVPTQEKQVPPKETIVTLYPGDTLFIGNHTEHTVKDGEKIWDISKMYNYKVRAILKHNSWLFVQNRVTYK